MTVIRPSVIVRMGLHRWAGPGGFHSLCGLWLVLLFALLLVAPSVLAETRVSLTVIGERSEGVSGPLIASTPRLLESIKEKTGLGFSGDVSVVLCTTKSAFQGYVSEYAHDGLNEVLGVAVAARRSIALNLEMIEEAGTRVEVVYKHELCHLVLGQNIVPWLRPLWIEEGLAQWVSETPYDSIQRAHGRSSGGGRDPVSLDDVSRMAATPDEMADGYAHALAAVSFIVSRHGKKGLQKLLANMAAVSPEATSVRFEEVYNDTFGESFALWQKDFIEERRRTWLGRVFGFFATYGWMVLALFAGVGAVWAVRRKRKRDQAVLDRWKEEDAYYPPDPSWAATEEPERDVDAIVQESLDKHFDGEQFDDEDFEEKPRR